MRLSWRRPCPQESNVTHYPVQDEGASGALHALAAARALADSAAEALAKTKQAARQARDFIVPLQVLPPLRVSAQARAACACARSVAFGCVEQRCGWRARTPRSPWGGLFSEDPAERVAHAPRHRLRLIARALRSYWLVRPECALCRHATQPPEPHQTKSALMEAGLRARQKPAPQEPKARPLGRVQLVLLRADLASGSAENCFAVFKCGPHWGRTALVSSASPAWNWEARARPRRAPCPPHAPPCTPPVQAMHAQQEGRFDH